jgi:hypothetical protein
MPVLDNPINTRLEIIKTLYKLSGKEANKRMSFYAAEIQGGYYSEIHYQMRFLKEKKLVDFERNIISKKFSASLTEAGVRFMEDAYNALALGENEKDSALQEIFSRIKM